MIGTIIQSVLTLLEAILPRLGVASSSEIGAVLDVLVKITPTIVADAGYLLAPIQNIITALKSSGALTADQMTQLEAASAAVDMAFEKAASDEGLAPPT